MSESFLNGRVTLFPGDCMEVLKGLPENSVDSVVTDPPYHLTSIVKRFGADNAAPAKSSGATGVYSRSAAGFMGKQWDGGDIAFRPETWAEVGRVLKPGGHLLAFAAPKNAHRLIYAVEDAGFEIRDCLQWIFGSGFPKSHDVSKGIDRAAGAEREVVRRGNAGERALGAQRRFDSGYRPQLQDNSSFDITAPATEAARQWAGWGTALKPAYEPIVLARKPLSEPTVAANVLKWGCGAINIDGCRVATDENLNGGAYAGSGGRQPMAGDEREGAALGMFQPGKTAGREFSQPQGRWPANLIHDGSEEVVRAFPETASGAFNQASKRAENKIYGKHAGYSDPKQYVGDSGSAARFFYTAKADAEDRAGSRHPTVKPLDLIQYLVRLVTPPKGTVLDPFAGTGTTGEAAWREGFSAILIEREAEYQADIARRMDWALQGPEGRSRSRAKLNPPTDPLPLFGEVA